MTDTTNPDFYSTRKEDPSKKSAMGPGEIERFNDLLIRALFADNIKAHASDEEREHVFGEIRAVCLTRGLTQFMDDLKTSNNAFVGIMSSYGANVATYMQTVLDNLHDAEQKGNTITSGEQELIKFFRDRGVAPRPIKEVDPFLEELRKFATKNGIPDSTFDGLVTMVDEDSGHDMDDGEEGCEWRDCPYHTVQHAMRDAVTNAVEKKFRGGQEGYSVVCPDHGRVFLSNDEYTEQLLDPDKGWFCTECGVKALLYEEEDDV